MVSLSESLAALEERLGPGELAPALRRLLRVPEALPLLRGPAAVERALASGGPLTARTLAIHMLNVSDFTRESWNQEARQKAAELAADASHPAARLAAQAAIAADMVHGLISGDPAISEQVEADPSHFRSPLALALPDLAGSDELATRLAGSPSFSVRMALINACLADDPSTHPADTFERVGVMISRQLIEDLLVAGESQVASALADSLRPAPPLPETADPEKQLDNAVAKRARLDLEAAHNNLEVAWESANERTARVADSMAELAHASDDIVLELQARQRALESRSTGLRRAALASALIRNDEPEQALRALTESSPCPQGRIAAGRAYLMMGDFTQARQSFEEVGDASSLDPRWLNSLADGWRALGELGRSVELLELGLKRIPGHLELRRRLAEMQFEAGQEEAAADNAAVIATLDPQIQEAKLLLARATQLAGRPAEALPAWLELVEEEPDLRPEAVDCALAADELATALSLAQSLVEEDPDSPRGRVALGKSMLAGGNPRAGRLHLRRATEIAPQDPEPWLALAATESELGSSKEAGETLAAAAQACPNVPSIHAAYGRWLAEAERWSEAAEAIKRARELDAGNPDYMAWHGQCLQQLGRLDEAQEELECSLARKPWNWRARAELAKLLERRGDFELAAEQLDGLPQAADPSDHVLAARVLLQQSAPAFAQEALEHLLWAQENDASRPDLYYWFGHAHHQLADYDDAIQAYQRCLEELTAEDSNLREACICGQAEAALAAEQFPVAISALEGARASGQAGPRTLILLSRAYSATDLIDEALTPAREAIDLAPDDPQVRWQFLQAAQAAGNPQLALDKLEIWVEEPSVEPDLLLHKAELHAEGGKTKEARGAIAAALVRGRHDTEVLRQAANVLTRVGCFAAAKRLLEIALDREPDRPDLAGALAKAAVGAEEPHTARRAWLKVLDAEPDSIEALVGAADAHWQLDQRVAAIGLLQRAVSRDPDRGDLHAQLARAQLKNGEVQRALEHFRLAAAKSPDNRNVTLEAARALIDNGSPEEAKEILEPLAQQALSDDAVVAASAEAYLELGRSEQSLTVLRRIPEDNRTLPILALLSLAHAASERPEEAVEAFERALETRAKSPLESGWLARAALQLGRWQEASKIAARLRGAENDPDSILAGVLVSCRLADARTLFSQLASAHKRSPSRDCASEEVWQACLQAIDGLPIAESETEALKDRISLAFQPETSQEIELSISALPRSRRLRQAAVEGKALAQIAFGDPERALQFLAESHRDAHSGRWGALLAGVAHLRAGRPQRARKALGAAGSDPLLSPLAAFFAGESWATESRWIEAINNLNTAVLDWPQEHGWQRRLAHYYLKDGRPEAALPHLQTALEITPDDVEVRLSLARTLRQAGHLSEADQAYAQAIDNENAAPIVISEAAEVALAVGDPPRASSLYARLLQLEPEWSSARVGAAKAALAAGDGNAAEKHAAAALRQSPEDPKVLMALGEVCARRGKHQQALELYERSQRWGGDSDDLLRARGQLLVKMGRAAEAVKSLRGLAESSTESDLTWSALAEAYQATGQTGQAIDALRMALRLRPGSPEYRVRLARLYRQAGQLDQALSELTELQSDQPDDYRVPLELGLVHKARRQYRRALASFEGAIQLEARSAAAYFQAGMVLKSLKAYPQASRMMARAVELNPDDSEALHQLAAVQALELVHGGIEATAVTQ